MDEKSLKMNFERGKDPKKSMDIGIKVYRCHYCGRFVAEDGSFLKEEEFEKMEKMDEQIRDSKTELVLGHCCMDEDNRDPGRMQVTRDMALDAGDPSLEGTWI